MEKTIRIRSKKFLLIYPKHLLHSKILRTVEKQLKSYTLDHCKYLIKRESGMEDVTFAYFELDTQPDTYVSKFKINFEGGEVECLYIPVFGSGELAIRYIMKINCNSDITTNFPQQLLDDFTYVLETLPGKIEEDSSSSATAKQIATINKYITQFSEEFAQGSGNATIMKKCIASLVNYKYNKKIKLSDELLDQINHCISSFRKNK